MHQLHRQASAIAWPTIERPASLPMPCSAVIASVAALTRRTCSSRVAVAAWLALATGACGGNLTVLREQVEARRLASDLHVQFTKVSDAANRAVMADTDQASTDAAHE